MTDFSRSNPHDQRVPVLLTSDEYLFARDEAERRGLSISAYFRQLLSGDRRGVNTTALSPVVPEPVSAEPAQELHNIVTLAVSIALKTYDQGKQV
jgi:hypothetical protein